MAILRNVLAVVVGAVVTGLVVMGIQMLAAQLFPPTIPMDLKRPEALGSFVQSLPAGALVSVVLAWTLGAFFGSATAIKVAKSHHALVAWFVAGLILAMIGVTVWNISHPGWMVAAGVVLPLAAVGLAVRWLAPRPPVSP